MKVVNSKRAAIEMFEAGDKYFVDKKSWTVKGVHKFMEQYRVPEKLYISLQNLYLCVVTELSKLTEGITEQVVHDYCSTGLALLHIDWDYVFEEPIKFYE